MGPHYKVGPLVAAYPTYRQGRRCMLRQWGKALRRQQGRMRARQRPSAAHDRRVYATGMLARQGRESGRGILSRQRFLYRDKLVQKQKKEKKKTQKSGVSQKHRTKMTQPPAAPRRNNHTYIKAMIITRTLRR